jgi:hypothetical protein
MKVNQDYFEIARTIMMSSSGDYRRALEDRVPHVDITKIRQIPIIFNCPNDYKIARGILKDYCTKSSKKYERVDLLIKSYETAKDRSCVVHRRGYRNLPFEIINIINARRPDPIERINIGNDIKKRFDLDRWDKIYTLLDVHNIIDFYLNLEKEELRFKQGKEKLKELGNGFILKPEYFGRW